MRFYFLTVWFVLKLLPLSGQSPSYVHYGVSEGLPGNKIYCALQDHRGFLWFGTDKGLARFDGIRFQVFGVQDGLPDPEVLTLFEDSHQRMWISCFSHRPCYMKNGRIFTSNTDSLLAKVNIKASLWWFSEDSDQNIWIAGKSPKVFVYGEKGVSEVDFEESTAQVTHIGDLNFALESTAIVQVNNGKRFEVSPFPNPGLSFATSQTHIVYGLMNGLILLEWVNGQIVERDRTTNLVGRVFPDNHNRFWYCTDTDGAFAYDVSSHQLANPVQYLPKEHVNSMVEDKQGTLWFCTGGHGVYALSPGKAFTYSQADGLETNNITAIARNGAKQLLAGDEAGNFYRFTGQHIQKTALSQAKENNRTRQIIPISRDTCWIANDKGLFYLTKGGVFKIERPGHKVFSGFKTILSTQEKLWYGNHFSLGYIPNSTLIPVEVIQDRTTALGEDDEGNVWAGRLNGIYSQRDSFKFNWSDSFPILNSRIVSIQKAKAHKIWVVTPDKGLLLGTVHHGALVSIEQINKRISKPIENIQSVFIGPEPANRVWMATNSGVYGINTDNWHILHFDKNDGLADNDVNCVWVADDTLWAGTPEGLSYFPLLAQQKSDQFGTFITGLQYQLAGKLVFQNLVDSLPSAHLLVVPPEAAMPTLMLSGLNYRSQGNFEYKCITTKILPPLLWWARQNVISWVLHGFKAESDTTIVRENSINYGVSLQSGAYKIKISAITTQEVESRYPDEWVIIMRPQWYNTIWFDLLAWGILFYLLWRILKARIAYRKLGQAVSDLQLQALQSQMNPHFVGNSINSIQQFFYPPNPGAASNYIEVFTRLLRRTITLSEKHFNPFHEELAYDRDYLQMIKLRFGERFQYEITGADTVPSDLPFPSMLLQPILENATIHGLAPEGVSHLALQFYYQENILRCSITDNGMGINAVKERPTAKPREYKSKGLELLEKKVQAFNALYDINLSLKISDLSEVSPAGSGTCVVITFNKKAKT